jgi:hypothetical protein
LHVCLRAISGTHDPNNSQLKPRISQFQRTALTTLHQILLSSYSLPLAELNLEHFLIERLTQSLESPDPFIQVLLLDAVFDALKIRNATKSPAAPSSPTLEQKRHVAQDAQPSSRLSLNIERSDHLSLIYLPRLRPSSNVSRLGFRLPAVGQFWIAGSAFLSNACPSFPTPFSKYLCR